MDSDVDVSRWVLELFLRDREKDCIAKRVLAVAPFADQDYRLKKTVLLRTIECEVYDASVSETILETLEMIEDLDISQGIDTMDSMKAAYLAVATDCTVKFLVGLMGKPSGKYLEAVDRIWRGRVGVLERSGASQLVSAELRERMDEVEAGVWDLRVSKKLSRMNTRNDALRLVAVYVKEALALMGPPFITWAVRLNVPKEVADLEGDKIAVVNEANVGGGSEVEAQTKNGANVGGRSELEVQMENATNVADGTELEAQMPNGAAVGGRSELEAKLANGANVSGESELEVQTAKGATNVSDGSELEGQMVNRTNVGNGSQLEVLTTNGTNLAGESELEVQMVKMVNEANVRYGSELGPQPMSGVQLQAVGAGSSAPTVSRSMVSNDFVEMLSRYSFSKTEPEMGSGFTNREVHRLADDQVHGEVNETAMALPIVNRELALSFDPTTKEIQRSTGLRHKHLAHRRTRGPVKIRDAEDLDKDLSNSKYDSLSTPEVKKAQEALKSSILELRAVVTDPLPDALRVAETVRSDLAVKPVNHVNGNDVGAENQFVEKDAEPVQSHKDNVGNMSSSHQNHVPQSSGKETDVRNLPANLGKGTESVQIDDTNHGNRSISNQNNVSRPSLMERNTTAHTYEWDDSIEMSQEGTREGTGRLHLPSPKRKAVSPLKKSENKRFTKRRKVKRWSLMEEDTLRTGVQKFGAGNWKLIWNSYRSIFEERTEVDLKDKWRNMTK